MHAKWMRPWGVGAVIPVLAPLLAVAQPRPREAAQTRALSSLVARCKSSMTGEKKSA